MNKQDRSKIKTTPEICNGDSYVLTGSGSFRGTFLLQVKDNMKPHWMSCMCITYALQEPFKKELERLQEHKIEAPLGMDETGQWCNNFVIVPKPNGTVHSWLDPMQLNQILPRPMHRG